MASYKLFAEKDATLISEYPDMNTGTDAILELSKGLSSLGGSSVGRSVIKFSNRDINDILNTINGNQFSCYLNIYSADIQGIPSDLTLYCHPLAQNYDMGTGKYGNVPTTVDGVCWSYRTNDTSSGWYQSGSYPTGVTGSYLIDNVGGGSWYTSSYASQSFGPYTNKDLSFDVTDIVKKQISGSISNYGFIIKNDPRIEFDNSYSYKLTYFSRDTNTIYPPTLEFRWNDYSGINISSSVINNQEIFVSLSNNKMEYSQNDIHRFRLNVRDKYPTRVFSTTSMFTTKKYLPTSSFYSIKDVKTDLVIIPFDNDYTKISSDSIGNYFDVYMGGLEPERWYKLQIKVDISGSSNVYDDEYNFKIKK